MNCLILQPGAVTLSDLAEIYWDYAPVRLDPACYVDIERAQAAITKASEGSEAIYGVNTGFGKLASVKICLLYTSPSPRDLSTSRMPSSA